MKSDPVKLAGFVRSRQIIHRGDVMFFLPNPNTCVNLSLVRKITRRSIGIVFDDECFDFGEDAEIVYETILESLKDGKINEKT
jgi:hypothetical protein